MDFLYIIVDGIDGVGKTTQVKRIATELENRGMKVVQVREPGGTKIGAQIRSILLNKSSDNISPATEVLLFFADRAQLHHETIRRELDETKMLGEQNKGKPVVVLSDRGMPSTYAYQYSSGRFDMNLMASLEKISGMVEPNLVLLLDLDESIALERALNRLAQSPQGQSPQGQSPQGQSPQGQSPQGQSPQGQSPQGQTPTGAIPTGANNLMDKEGRFESRGLDYYKSIRQGFHNYAKSSRVDVRIVDASGSSDDVFARLLAEVNSITGK